MHRCHGFQPGDAAQCSLFDHVFVDSFWSRSHLHVYLSCLQLAAVSLTVLVTKHTHCIMAGYSTVMLQSAHGAELCKVRSTMPYRGVHPTHSFDPARHSCSASPQPRHSLAKCNCTASLQSCLSAERPGRQKKRSQVPCTAHKQNTDA